MAVVEVLESDRPGPPQAPAAVPPPYASVGRRGVAVVIDAVCLLAFGWVIALAAGATSGVSYEARGSAAVVLLVGFGVYHVLMEAGYGATVGKLVVGIQVRADDGTSPSAAAAVIRNVLRLVDGIPLYVTGAVLAWRSPARQRLGDRLAGTVVVVVRPAPPGDVPIAWPGSAGTGGRRRRRLAAALGVGAVALVGIGVAAGAAFEVGVQVGSSETVGTRAVERALQEEYADRGIPISEADCPGDIREDDPVSCTARLDAKTVDLDVVVTNAETGSFRAEPRQSILPVATVERIVGEFLSDQRGVRVTMDCGSEQFLVRRPAERFTCTASWDGGTEVVGATVDDNEGNFTLDL